MNLAEMIRMLVLGPIELVLDGIFSLALRAVGSPGMAIVLLSLAVNFIVMPLYRRADALQAEEREQALRMKPRIDQIKKAFTGDERFMILQTYYRQNNYKPYYVLKGSLPLLLQIPFFMAAYYFLSHLGVLQGAAFGPIRDLGAPDGLVRIGGVSLNLLPVIMTLVNVVSGMIYTRGMPLKSKIQLFGMAAVFLVLLYGSPAGLVLYWTLNNVFSLVKNLIGKRAKKTAVAVKTADAAETVETADTAADAEPAAATDTADAEKTGKKAGLGIAPEACRWVFPLACVFLALLTGILIPSAVINASPTEFMDLRAAANPARYLVPSGLLGFGMFVLWGEVYYRLAGKKARAGMAAVFAGLAVFAAVNYMAFGGGYGDMSSLLKYDHALAAEAWPIVLEYLALFAVVFGVLFLLKRFPGILRILLLSGCIAMAAMGGMNISGISAKAAEVMARAGEADPGRPEIRLSRTGKNVVVIMLDRAVNGFVPFMLNERPELQEQFSGFTYYPNTLSFGFHTNVGAPPLYGGYEYTPDGMAERTELTLREKHNEALKVMPVLFDSLGYDVTVMDASLADYQWIPDMRIYSDYPEIHAYNAAGAFGDADTLVLDPERVRNRNFFRYGLFRASPVFLQPVVYDEGYYLDTDARAGSLSSVPAYFMDQYLVMENLAGMTEITEEEAGCFLLLANEETHNLAELSVPDYVPRAKVNNYNYEAEHGVRTAADGRELDLFNGGYSLQVHYQCNMSAFLQLGRWFDTLRAEGVWDNTRIIVVSDHAYYLGVFGLDLTEKYPEISRESEVNGEIWTNTTAYNPLLMVKDFGASGFTTDNTFMTNADTPLLALDGIMDNPVNPFTGKVLDDSAKKAGYLHLIETDWHIEDNNGVSFADPQVLTFIGEDIFDMDNWLVGYAEAEE